MLAGIYFRRESDMLVFASTDSFRLSDMRIETEPDEASSAIIIP